MRVLVTGAGGFVGSHIVRHLIASGAEVAAIVRGPGDSARLEGLADRLTLIPGDLAQPETWRARLVDWKPDGCVHAAWYAEPGLYLQSTESLGALRYSLGLLEELASAGCRNVVMTGTCFEYDTDAGYLKEDTPVRPQTLYAACKLALSFAAAQRAAQLSMHFAWARIFYVYGPHEDPRRLVPALTLSLLRGEPFSATSGEQVRDYMHVEDVAAGIASLALAGCDGVYNVCSGEPTTMARLMLEIGRLLGREDLIMLGARPAGQFEPPFICGDNRRLRAATGWKRQHTLAEGLARTVDWWKQHRAEPAR